MHLMLTCRRDPPLPIHQLRASHHLVEIRGGSLRFRRDEIGAFIENASGALLDDRARDILERKTEGWAVGLRMATLSMLPGGDVEPSMAELEKGNRYVLEYLTREALSQPVIISFGVYEPLFAERSTSQRISNSERE